MATPTQANGPVILFMHEGYAYEYRQHLGVGPHGEVLLLAYQRRAAERIAEVVLKCVAFSSSPQSEGVRKARARLEEEVRLARHLSHRGLMRVLFQHETPDMLYTAREHINAPPLDALVTLTLEKRPFSERFLLYVGAELASALDHLHTRVDEHGHPLNIVHRALCPSTTLFTWRGGVKLGDLSLASSNLPDRMLSSKRQPRAPLFFHAPETLLHGQAEARSDLFALGLLLLELGTGKHLYDPAYKTLPAMKSSVPRAERRNVERAVREARRLNDDDLLELALWGAATFTPEDVERMASRLPAPLKSIVARLLRRELGERFQTAAEVEQAMRAQLAAGAVPYGSAQALDEMHRMMTEVGQDMIEAEVSPWLRSPSPNAQPLSLQDTTR